MLFREFRISQTESVTKEKAYLLTKISAPKPGEQLSSEDKHTLLVARAVLRPEESTLGILPEEISKMQANMETFEQVFSEKYQNFQELATTINMLKRAIELRTIDKTAPIKPLSELKKQNESCCVIS